MDKTYTFTLTENELRNLIYDYANEYYDVQYHYSESASGYCNCARNWMNVLGISPESNFVQEIIYNVCYKDKE